MRPVEMEELAVPWVLHTGQPPCYLEEQCHSLRTTPKEPN